MYRSDHEPVLLKLDSLALFKSVLLVPEDFFYSFLPNFKSTQGFLAILCVLKILYILSQISHHRKKYPPYPHFTITIHSTASATKLSINIGFNTSDWLY